MSADIPVILITRPAEDAVRMAHMLKLRGYGTFLEPMLKLRYLLGGVAMLEHAACNALQAVIVTSRHALLALERHASLHHLPLYAVGSGASYEGAYSGFAHVVTAPDAAALRRQVLTHCAPEKGALLYVRGKHVTFDFSKLMMRQGFVLNEVTVYDMPAAAAFTPKLCDALQNGALHTATFFSARTAEVFLRLTEEAGMTETLKRLNAVALSPKIAEALSVRAWKRIASAAEPSLPSLLAEVDKQVSAG